MKSADILYLPLPDGSYSATGLPGKIFEYVGSGRRILTSVETASEVYRLLSQTGNFAAVPPKDVAAMARFLEALVSRDFVSLFGKRDNDCAHRYERGVQAALLANIFGEVVGVKSRAK